MRTRSSALFFFVLVMGIVMGPAQALAKTSPDDLTVARGAIEDGLYGIASSRLDQYLRRGAKVEKLDEAKILRGQARFFVGRIVDAREDFASVLARNSEGPWLAEANYWLGECAYTQEDFETAIEYYKTTIRRFPKSSVQPLALFGLGWSFYRAGDDAQAAETFKRIIKGHSRHEVFGEAQYKYAECLYRMERWDNAGYAFRQFLKKHRDSPLAPVARFWLGEINYLLERYETAEENYQDAIANASLAPEEARAQWLGKAHYGLAWSAYKQGDDTKTLAHLDRFTEYYSKDRLLDSALFLTGVSRARLGEAPKAIHAFDELVRRFPQSPWARRASFHKATLQFEAEDPQDALVTLLQMERVGVQDELAAHVLYKIGRIYTDQGDPEQAVRWLERLLSREDVDPGVAEPARILLGDAWARSGDSQKALELYDQVLKASSHHPSAAVAQYRVGEVLYSLQKYDTAMSAFRSLAVNFPEAPFRDQAQYKIGWCYFHLGDHVTAAKYFDRMAGEFPESALMMDARLMAAESAYNAGRFKEALGRFRKIRSETPDESWHPQLAYGIAWAAWQLDDTEAAVKTFRSLVKSHPSHPLTTDALFWLGQYHADQGEWDAAQRYYREIPLRFPQHELVDDALYWSGWADYRKGDTLSAMEQFKGLAARYRKSPLAGDALFHTAQILSEQKKPKNALEYYERALEAAPVSLRPQIQFHLARSYQEIKNHDQAILEYLKVVYLYPDASDWAAKAQLQVAWLFEREERWQEARKIYAKIADRDGEEATVARNRLSWIEENIK